MSNEDSIQNSINNWLLDEGLTVSKQTDESADFHFLVPNAYNLGFIINVLKPKNRTLVVIGMGTKIPPQMKNKLGELKESERLRFTNGVQRELLKFNVEHRLKPNSATLDIIEISDVVYVDDITRTLFMTTLKRVKNAMLFFMWSFGTKFDVSTPSKSPSAYG